MQMVKGSTLAGGLGNTGVGMWSSVFGGSKNEAVGTGASMPWWWRS